MPRRRLLWVALLLSLLGGWLLGQAGVVQAKAWLAQVLLEQAWQRSLEAPESRAAERPWPWADSYPVARLRVPSLGVDQIVLAGASGRSMAFGPAHLDGSTAPGAPGHSLLFGHRDTHFRYLEALMPGVGVSVQGRDGLWRDYRVVDRQVVDSRRARLLPSDGLARLSLVTCYPFDSLVPGGPLRYVVHAVAESDQAADRADAPIRRAEGARRGAAAATQTESQARTSNTKSRTSLSLTM